MTEKLFLLDSYLKSSESKIESILGQGIILEATNFYARSGGQPGDNGILHTTNGDIEIVDTIYSEDRQKILHIMADAADIEKISIGDPITTELNWENRYNIMRMHSCMHLLSVVLSYPVTGGQMTASDGRLDFDLPEMPKTKEEITEEINDLIRAGHIISEDSITDEELDQNPDLVKTMSVKPPRGTGYIRLIRIGDIDLQPCGGTHVANTSEIGSVEVYKVEKKGKINRRVRVRFL